MRLTDGLDECATMQRARGRVDLALAARGDVTVLADLRQEGCLKIRFARGRGMEAALLNTSGGVAAGDRLTVSVRLAPRAAAMFSTQAAERIYRARPGDKPAQLRATISLDEGAALDWLPQETILFDGCALDRQLDVSLANSARFLGTEMLVFGRAAMGETVRTGTLRDRIRVLRDGRPIFQDAIRLEGAVAETLARPAVAAGRRAVATLLLVAPDADRWLDPLRGALAHAPAECGASSWNGMLVASFLAHDSQALRRAVAAGLAALRPGRALPRVWLC